MLEWVKFFVLAVGAVYFEMVWDSLFRFILPPPNMTHLVALTMAVELGARRGALVAGGVGVLSAAAAFGPNGVEILSLMGAGVLAGWLGRWVVGAEERGIRFLVVAILLFVVTTLQSLGAWGLIVSTEVGLPGQGLPTGSHPFPGMDWIGALLALFFWPMATALTRRIRIDPLDIKPDPLSASS